jgi:hypothetical protein
MAAGLTLADAAAILDPPIGERQLRQIVTALRWEPCGHQGSGRPGHPRPLYDLAEIMRLHAALVPWLVAAPIAGM